MSKERRGEGGRGEGEIGGGKVRKGESMGDINGKLASENKLSWGEREGMRRRGGTREEEDAKYEEGGRRKRREKHLYVPEPIVKILSKSAQSAICLYSCGD